MDINRYFVAAQPKKETTEQRQKKFQAATSRFSRTNVRLPTPQAFFERQRDFKDADRAAMMRFAEKKTVKHNLKLRRNELKNQQKAAIEELTKKINNVDREPFENDSDGEVDVEVEAVTNDKGEVTGFHYPGLKKAVDSKDEGGLNRQVLERFFAVKDKSRVNDVEALLEEYQGREFELFDKIAKDYSVLRANVPRHDSRPTRGRVQSYTSMKEYTPQAQAQVRSSFVEQDLTGLNDEDEQEINSPAHGVPPSPQGIHIGRPTSQKHPLPIPKGDSLMAKVKRLTKRSQNDQSVLSVETAVLSLDPEREDVKEFQEALDKEIKDKQYTGEYVTSIMERGGRWWVNRDPPKVHPSQRRRDTLLDDLRTGNVPLTL